MTYLFKAVKELIRSAAESHSTTPGTLLRLFRHSSKVPGSALTNFANLMAMCSSDPDSVEAFNAGQHIEISDAKWDQPTLDQYKFLYHSIDNFYERKVETFDSLTFYPRIEDLFPKPELSDKAKILLSLVKPVSAIEPSVRKWEWNAQQDSALKAVRKWLRTKKRKQIYRLFGYAGTGKSELSKTIADFVMNEGGNNNVPKGEVLVESSVPTGPVLFSAYTGKAASVMRTKGCRGAETLHSLLYKPVIDPVSGKCTDFILNPESPIRFAALIIVDECSMVNEEMAKDIMSFGTAILVLGDPFQLRPVKGEGYFINAEPDSMLTDVERQAKENPIIWLATRVRNGKTLKPGKYGDSVIYDYGKHISDEMYLEHDQIICGLNPTRKTANQRMRRINGKHAKNPLYPTEGERLMCLRNNRTAGLYNGTIWTSEQPTIQKVMKPIFKGSNVRRPGDIDVLAFKVHSVDEMDPQGNPYIVETQCSLHFFNENMKEPEYRDIAGTDQWTFGYAATVHKFQGSQADTVLFYDESATFREFANNHRYTGITRAAERITILL